MKGLVLEGGGTKGAYQIGAYKALRDLGIEFQGVAGTSIGALNGAYILQDDIEIMEDIWLTYDYTYFMNIEEEVYEKYKHVDFTPKNINTVIELINKARKNQGIDISPLKSLLKKTLNEDYIRKCNKDFGLVTVSWDKKLNPHPLYLEDIPEGRLVDYLIASSSLPIFKLDKMDDKLYLDGMFSDNMPVALLSERGYEDIVVIRLLDDFLGKRNLSKYENLNIKTIAPSEYLGGGLNKDKEHVQKNITLGYLDTMKAYNRYDGIKYYFNVDYKFDEEYCFNKLKNLDKTTLEYISKLINVKREPNLRTLMETIIPKCGEILGLKKDFTYKDIFYGIYEKKLEENKINRIGLYDFSKLLEVINKNINENNVNLSNLELKPISQIQKNKLLNLLTNAFIQDFKRQG